MVFRLFWGLSMDADQINRTNIISAVTTPLAFLTLALLAVELIFVSVLANSSVEHKPLLLFLILGAFIVFVLIVVLVAIFRPEALQGKRPLPQLHANNLADDLYFSIEGSFANLDFAAQEDGWQFIDDILRSNQGNRDKDYIVFREMIADR